MVLDGQDYDSTDVRVNGVISGPLSILVLVRLAVLSVDHDALDRRRRETESRLQTMARPPRGRPHSFVARYMAETSSSPSYANCPQRRHQPDRRRRSSHPNHATHQRKHRHADLPGRRNYPRRTDPRSRPTDVYVQGRRSRIAGGIENWRCTGHALLAKTTGSYDTCDTNTGGGRYAGQAYDPSAPCHVRRRPFVNQVGRRSLGRAVWALRFSL